MVGSYCIQELGGIAREGTPGLFLEDTWSVVLLHVHDCSRCWRGRQGERNELMVSSGHHGGGGVH